MCPYINTIMLRGVSFFQSVADPAMRKSAMLFEQYNVKEQIKPGRQKSVVEYVINFVLCQARKKT